MLNSFFSSFSGGFPGPSVSVAPSVVSVVNATSSPTTLKSGITFTVTFDQSVTGVDVADFQITKTGSVVGESITSVSGSGTTYTVTVNAGWENGTIRLDVLANGTIINAASQPLSGAFTSGSVLTIARWHPSDDASYVDSFDAKSDDSKITTAGSTVTAWATRSASGNTLACSANHPSHSTSNDRVDFNVTGTLIDSSLASGAVTNGTCCMYVVFAHDKVSNGYIVNIDDGDTNPGFGLRYFSPNWHIYFDPSGTTGSMTSSAAGDPASTKMMLGGISNGSGATTLAISKNGTVSSFSGSTTRFTGTRYHVNKTASTALDYIHEIVIMSSSDSSVYQKVEGYLAAKYDVTITLGGHPYITIPP